MPSVPSTSPATGLPLHPSYIHTTSLNFVDNHGRTLLLRGVNLSGASKAPVGHLSNELEDFWESAERGGLSFVGRPLNVDDGSADVHLARLRGWGFNLLRFPFTWEALEHEGPGKYDHEFMDYTIRVLCKCRDYGFRVYMDPHQDTWSRFSGGSGAPFWTLAACGIDPRNITATQAAIVHSEYPLAHEPDPASLPAMIWSTNYGRLLSQTVFTLFFAGRDFAPNCIIDGANIQDYLQSHYIEACGQLADRIRDFDNGSLFEECIIGWDSMNEPFEGLCGWDDLNVNPTKQGSTLKKGTYPTPAQSLRLGMGQKQTVDHWTFGGMGPARDGSVTIDPKGYKLWADIDEDEGELPDGTHPRWGWKRDVSKWPLGTCIWARHGVWDVETGFVLRPDYFRFRPSRESSSGDEVEFIEVEFLSDYWKPHWLAYAARIRPTHPEAIIFVQPPVFAPPPWMSEEELKGRCAYSPHYYDGLTLVTRHWNFYNADALGLLRGKYSSTIGPVKLGEGAIRKSLQEQIGYLQDDVAVLGSESSGVLSRSPSTTTLPTTYGGINSVPTPVGKYPTLIGEIGVPFDMDSKRSYGWTDGGKHKGDYSSQEKALDASLNACDGPRPTNWTVWTYVPDDHSHEWGDGWNLEDLSLFSMDDLAEDDELDGVVNKEMEQLRQEDEEDMSEEALNSRAVLLADRDREDEGQERQGRRRSVKNMQPLQSMAMTAACGSTSQHSLATLGGGPTTQTHTNQRLKPKSSTLSMSTISTVSTSSSSTSPRMRMRTSAKQHPYDGIAGFDANPFTFLTNGARAVRAFARPWPVKVVGRPVDVKFDVGKGVFKLVVLVGSEDQDRSRSVGGRSTLKHGGEVRVEVVGEDDDETTATEIYIPLVHYAHQKLVDDVLHRRSQSSPASASGALHRRTRTEEEADAMSIASGATATAASAAAPRKVPTPETETNTIIVEVESKPPSILAFGKDLSASASSSGSSDPRKNVVRCQTLVAPQCPCIVGDSYSPSSAYTSPEDTDDSAIPLIDVEVKVSHGRVKVVGQRVLWWYDVPKEGEVARKVEVEVKRRGGVLKVPPRKPGPVRGKRGLEARSAAAGLGGWCEEFCGESCVVM